MTKNRARIPLYLLGSGVALTACGLAFMIAEGAKTPPGLIVLVLVGIIDGLTGLVWAVAAMIAQGARPPDCIPRAAESDGRPVEAPPRAEARAKRALFIATGVLMILFLGILVALALYSQLILGWFRSGRLI
jgi:hypothetical protein